MIIRTDKWLLNSYDKPLELCKQLIGLFENATTYEIYEYLVLHGMYQPDKDGKEQVRQLKEKRIWDIVVEEEKKLQQLWHGPDIPIFIFPSDAHNEILKQEFNGKAGLAFKDKLFLFISTDNSEMEFRALLTHEYNHVCRLTHYQKAEKDYVLLDTLILEGLAESAVLERFGQSYLSHWMSFYSEEELEQMWRTKVSPYIHTRKSSIDHDEILYGLPDSPRMLGYCVGYYLVQKFIKEQHSTVGELLNEPSQSFLK